MLEVKPILLFAKTCSIQFLPIRSCTDTSLPILVLSENSSSVPTNTQDVKVVRSVAKKPAKNKMKDFLALYQKAGQTFPVLPIHGGYIMMFISASSAVRGDLILRV